jgi:hypothetical protein
MVVSNASFVHMSFLVIEGTRFSCGFDLFLYGSRIGGRLFCLM